MSTNPISYYSTECILTENEKATCSFELDIPNHLHVLNAGSQIKTGTKLELPLWIAEMLAVSKPDTQNSLVNLDLPTCLGPRVMNALRADPKSVDLRQQSAFFYGVGERMLELFDEEEVAEVMGDTFKQRAMEIADRAQNHKNERTPFMDGLDERERRLYNAAYEGSKTVKDWFNANRE